jgi:hypothetical protein
MKHRTSKIGICCQQHPVPFIIVVLPRTRWSSLAHENMDGAYITWWNDDQNPSAASITNEFKHWQNEGKFGFCYQVRHLISILIDSRNTLRPNALHMPTRSSAKLLNLTKSCIFSFSSVIFNLCLTEDTSSSKLPYPVKSYDNQLYLEDCNHILYIQLNHQTRTYHKWTYACAPFGLEA